MAKKDKTTGKAEKIAKKAKRVEVALPEAITPEVVDDLSGGGANLCYGEPVREGGRTVIPVARVGSSGESVGAKPVGYIEVDADGARFTRIDGLGVRDGMIAAAAAAAAGLLGALLGVALGRRRR